MIDQRKMPPKHTKTNVVKDDEYTPVDEATVYRRAQTVIDRFTPSLFKRIHLEKLQLLTTMRYAEIYSGKYEKLPVSIKKMSLRDSLQEKNKKDAHYLQQFDCPYIAKVIDELITPYHCLVLEPFVETLNTALKSGTSHFESISSCLKIASNIAEGLAYLHKKDYIVCNLHSDNILLNVESQAKLIDMKYLAHREEKREVHGKLSYLPAEALRNNRNEQSSDIYSFGVLLLEILYRRYDRSASFINDIILDTEDTSVDEVMKDIINGMMHTKLILTLYVLQANDACSEPLANLIKQCIDQDPQKRPTAANIAKELNAMIEVQVHAPSFRRC